MSFSFVAKASVLLLFLGSTLYMHLRGKARLPVLRQFVNHSALFAPYNALMYLFFRCTFQTLPGPQQVPRTGCAQGQLGSYPRRSHALV